MKVTNISSVEMRVRGVDGVVAIAPGKSMQVQFTDDQLARARSRSYLVIDPVTPNAAPLASTGLTAKHRGGGSYSVMDGKGEELVSGLSKEDAEAFNVLSDEDKAFYVANG